MRTGVFVPVAIDERKALSVQGAQKENTAGARCKGQDQLAVQVGAGLDLDRTL